MSLLFTLYPFSTTERLITSWKPKGCSTEKELEQSLVRKLRKELKNHKIETQYGSGSQRIDIVIDGKVPIEIKRYLKTTSALQRIIGQLDLYLENWEKIILALCGEIKPNLLIQLKEYVEDKTDIILDERVIIVVKGRIVG